MTKSNRRKRASGRAGTADRLIEAAMREFNTRGFEGTDTNRIARAAGFAPQTFYRHFEDKTAIFVAVYDRWWRSETASLGRAVGGDSSSGAAAARVVLAFHTRWRVFRHSLRHLAIVDPRVRQARTAARRAQIANLKRLSNRRGMTVSEFAAALLTAERLCDAVAEGELVDLGLSRATSRKMVARAMATLLDG